MIGRVGRDPRTQLYGLLHAQQLKLAAAESETPRNESAIAAISAAIEATIRKLDQLDACDMHRRS